MVGEFEPEREISKFNEAGLAIMRLHELWVKSETLATSGQLLKWHWSLDSIWRELYADVLRLKDKEEIIESNNQFLKLISASMPKIIVGKPEQIPTKKTPLYYLLNKRHEFLKKIQDDAGKGGVYHDIAEEDFD